MFLTLLHPATVHFPIALLISASVAGLAYIHWRPMPALRTIVWWGMAAGWLSLVAAIITGLIAQGPLPPNAPYRTLLNWHTTSGLLLGALYGDILYRGWLHNSGKGKKTRNTRQPVPASPVEFLVDPRRKWLLTLELVLGLVLIFLSGWLGGELVYTWGVNVGE